MFKEKRDTVSVPVRKLSVCALLAAGVLLPGCINGPRPGSAAIPPPPVPYEGPSSLPSEDPVQQVRSGECKAEVIGFSVRKQPIWAWVFPGKKPAVMIIGGIHGNEPIASALAEVFYKHLQAHPEARGGRTVVLVQRANPDGLEDNTRYNVHGVDLNRNFPSENFLANDRNGSRPLCEPESRALFKLVNRVRPACIVSIHGPLECIDPDGGQGSVDLARRMAAVSDLPIKDLEAYPGSLGSYCGETMGINTVTYELDRKGLIANGQDEYLRRHLPALLTAVREGTANVAK